MCWTSGSQTFMSHGPLLRLTGEYLIYRDTWVMQYHSKATWWRPLLVALRELHCDPKGGWGPHLRNLVRNYIKGLKVMLCKSSINITRAMELVEDTRKSIWNVCHRGGAWGFPWRMDQTGMQNGGRSCNHYSHGPPLCGSQMHKENIRAAIPDE